MNMRGEDNGEEDQQTLLQQLSQEEIDELRKMVNMEKAIYGKLVNSIAPTVFGKHFLSFIYFITGNWVLTTES